MLELETRLNQKGYTSQEITSVINFLQENNYQSDQRFTEAFVRNRLNKGSGPKKIIAELQSRGIDICENQLEITDQQWISVCKKVREKKFGNGFPVSINEKNKQIRFLIYRGFSYDHVKCALSDE